MTKRERETRRVAALKRDEEATKRLHELCNELESSGVQAALGGAAAVALPIACSCTDGCACMAHEVPAAKIHGKRGGA